MGCDIHMYIERKMHINKVEKWFDISAYQRNPYFEQFQEDGESEWNVFDFYKDRNYRLFELLAGVRGHASNAISLAKGLPEDVSDGIKKASDEYGADGHSHSHYLFSELLAIDWPKFNDKYETLDVWVKALAYLKERIGWYGTDKIRIVFWFDN